MTAISWVNCFSEVVIDAYSIFSDNSNVFGRIFCFGKARIFQPKTFFQFHAKRQKKVKNDVFHWCTPWIVTSLRSSRRWYEKYTRSTCTSQWDKMTFRFFGLESYISCSLCIQSPLKKRRGTHISKYQKHVIDSSWVPRIWINNFTKLPRFLHYATRKLVWVEHTKLDDKA